MSGLTYKLTVNKFPQIEAQLRARAAQAVRKASFDVERSVKGSMGGTKSGRAYPRAGGRVHIASAPGEAPAIDYGTLVNSIATEFPDDLRGVVYSPLPYSAYLEFGTAHIAPRPAWVPAAEAAWPGFLAAMQKLIG